MLGSPSLLRSKSTAYAPQTYLCTVVVITDPIHLKHSSITDLCAIATPPSSFQVIIRVRRDRDPPMIGASRPRPLPSVVRYRLKNQAAVSNHRRPRLIQTYESPISDGVHLYVRRCGSPWRRRAADGYARRRIYAVRALIPETTIVRIMRQRLGPLGGMPCM